MACENERVRRQLDTDGCVVYMGPMFGAFVKPWKGESFGGEIVSRTGDYLVCRTVNGLVFLVRLEDLAKMEIYRPRSMPLLPERCLS